MKPPNRWIVVALVIKCLLFAYFSVQVNALPPDQYVGALFRVYDDTKGYYTPVELLLEGKGYSRHGYAAFGEPEIVPFAGRLPGILPVYAPLYALFGEVWAKQLVILLQFLFSTWAAFALGFIAKTWFPKNQHVD
ncbi:MAG: hypothetical protein AAGI38_07050, partial [Bacteroidota bacterium]